jgi:hypothetical protein
MRSQAMARASGLRYLRASQWHPGLLVAASNHNGIPAVELEIGGLGRVTESGRREYLKVIYRILSFLGTLAAANATDESAPPQPVLVTHKFVLAPIGGFFERRVALGQEVQPSDVLGELTDLFGAVTATIRCSLETNSFTSSTRSSSSRNSEPQYTSVAVGAHLQAAGIAASMGTPGGAYDNAMAESFFASLETELIDRSSWLTMEAARSAVFDYIEISTTGPAVTRPWAISAPWVREEVPFGHRRRLIDRPRNRGNSK